MPLPLPVSGPTILVVDDTPAVREVVRRSLEYAGYRVYEASDGEEALTLLAHTPVDLVVSDLRMPRIDGRTLALEMRRRSLGIPLLFISGYDAHIPGIEMPAPMLPKPFTPELLIESVHRLLMGPQPRSA